MTIGVAFETLAKRWKAVSTIGALFVISSLWVVDQTRMASASGSKNKSQDERLETIEKLTIEMAAKINGIDDNLKLILQLYGIDSSKVNRWRRIPAKPVIDTTTGFPAFGSKWLKMSDNRKQGWLYRADKDSATGDLQIEAVELWNLAKKTE